MSGIEMVELKDKLREASETYKFLNSLVADELNLNMKKGCRTKITVSDKEIQISRKTTNRILETVNNELKRVLEEMSFDIISNYDKEEDEGI